MKRFNIDELVWFMVLCLLNLWVIYLLKSEQASLYIGKSMIKYLYFAVIILTLMIIFQIPNIFTPKNRSRIIIKTLPIIISIILGFISLNSQDTFRHIELNKELTHSIGENHMHDHEEELSKDEKMEEEKSLKMDSIVIDDKNAFLLEIINMKPEKYINKYVEVHGFICSENYLRDNQFITGRIIMNCCAADSEVVGIICEKNEKTKFKENEKVCVKGIISYSYVTGQDNEDFKVPVLKVESVERE